MKKILILGGSKAQVPLIKAAKKAGYYTVLCDWTTTNPGIQLADKHYQVSTMDIQAVLEVAEKEAVNGVVSNSEPVMVNVAMVAEHLNLPGNPPQAIEILQSKNKFRKFQEKIGIFSPKSVEVETKEEAMECIKNISFPIVLKPSKSSGSRGTTVIEEADITGLEEVFAECQAFSTNNKVTVEEYVKMPSLFNIEGDVFVCNGEILWNGMFTTFRSPHLPMVPEGDIFPVVISKEQLAKVKQEITLIFRELGIMHGEYNIESFYTDTGKLFIIEINARQGGNSIPSLVEDHSGVDMYKLLVTTAVGDNDYWNKIYGQECEKNYITNYIVFSREDGYYKGLEIDDRISKYVYDITEKCTIGSKVRAAKNASDAVGMVRLKFSTQKEQLEFSKNIEKLICPVIDTNNMK